MSQREGPASSVPRLFLIALAKVALHNLAMTALTKITGFLIFVVAAIIAAKLLGDFAHSELGITRGALRTDALLAALVWSGIVGIAFYSDRFGKRD